MFSGWQRSITFARLICTVRVAKQATYVQIEPNEFALELQQVVRSKFALHDLALALGMSLMKASWLPTPLPYFLIDLSTTT